MCVRRCSRVWWRAECMCVQRFRQVSLGFSHSHTLVFAAETKEVFDLQSMQTINAAVAAVKEHLGMQAAEGSDKPSASATHHTLKLYGLYVGQVAVMVKAEMVIDQRKGGVKLRLTARSESEPVRTLLVSLIS
uniref:Coatomer subunit gamma C-terminal domain-containing protein n=1 Tax=Palpitomonas bilix TaxID=652834 RepID=A0A7S3DLF8_9EUKA|mmetsp:Transcript_42986/g.111060  ORF Transcript_42986/g.111060 Transcript_42986/m.111060 type:complete len:133 (+) Transcript_42986:463-861(+)